MAFEEHDLKASRELTGIFRLSREEASEETVKEIDKIWAAFQIAVRGINSSSEDDLHRKEMMRKAEGIAFALLNNLFKKKEIDERIAQLSGSDKLEDSEALRAAIRECEDDELLYQIAKRAPHNMFFSFGDVAASCIKSNEYRYALLSSNFTCRRTPIHDLAVSRELDEMTAARILLTDSVAENKRESMYVINSEALLMLGYLKSFSYRTTAKEKLQEIGSSCPGRYFELDQDEKDEVMKNWLAEACGYAEKLIEMDRTVSEKTSLLINIDSEKLITFLAACHPEQSKRAEYARMITSEAMIAYAGAVTEYADVKKLLSVRIHDEDVLGALPYCESLYPDTFLLKDSEENHVAFCLEILQNTESEEIKEYLLERMKYAGIEIPEELS